jgi:hypothetical protein
VDGVYIMGKMINSYEISVAKSEQTTQIWGINLRWKDSVMVH